LKLDIKDFRCPVCGGTSFGQIDSYKHTWLLCRRCGNATRRRKEAYLIPRILPNIVGDRLSARVRNKFYPIDEVREDESRFYEYYSEVLDKSLKDDSKWHEQSSVVSRQLGGDGFSWGGKRVLDVSGEPGFFAKEVEEAEGSVVITGYSPVVAEAMRKYLGLEAVKFDYNVDDIGEVVDGNFDVVLIRYSINFCNDLRGFARELRDRVHEGSKVLVSFTTPTLGCCLRWQHDEYTYNVLYRPDTMRDVFGEQGFELVSSIDEGSYGFMDERRLWQRIFAVPYAVSGLLDGGGIDRDLSQRNLVHVYNYVG
jgi:hypothetical protein